MTKTSLKTSTTFVWSSPSITPPIGGVSGAPWSVTTCLYCNTTAHITSYNATDTFVSASNPLTSMVPPSSTMAITPEISQHRTALRLSTTTETVHRITGLTASSTSDNRSSLKSGTQYSPTSSIDIPLLPLPTSASSKPSRWSDTHHPTIAAITHTPSADGQPPQTEGVPTETPSSTQPPRSWTSSRHSASTSSSNLPFPSTATTYAPPNILSIVTSLALASHQSAQTTASTLGNPDTGTSVHTKFWPTSNPDTSMAATVLASPPATAHPGADPTSQTTHTQAFGPAPSESFLPGSESLAEPSPASFPEASPYTRPEGTASMDSPLAASLGASQDDPFSMPTGRPPTTLGSASVSASTAFGASASAGNNVGASTRKTASGPTEGESQSATAVAPVISQAGANGGRFRRMDGELGGWVVGAWGLVVARV